MVSILKHFKPTVVINAAAIASVDNCAEDPTKAFLENATFPQNLAMETSKFGAKFIHLSTDAVFGQKGSYFSEDQTPEPNSVYSQSKLEGEQKVSMMDPNALIIRTRPIGWDFGGKTLFEYFSSHLRMGLEVKGFTNVFFTPIFIDTAIKAIVHLVEINEKGVWHVVAGERMSKFDFGVLVAEIQGASPKLLIKAMYVPDSIMGERGLDTSLSNSKLQIRYGLVPSVASSLRTAEMNKRQEKV